MQRFVTPENKKWWTLGAVSVGLFMIMLDNTVVNVALPAMQHSLHMTLSELEWVVAGYALTFAAFMLTGGKLADLLGRRLIFTLGLAVFTGASLACGLAPNGGFLIGARVVQGLGGALMNPATLSIITATFPPRERGRAIGIWAGVSAMALAIGPLVGGLLTEHVNWNWIFFINVPIGILGLLAIPFFVDESRDTSHEQRPDVPGLISSGIGLFSLTYAFIESNNYGWGAPRAGKLSDHFGSRWLVGGGMTLLAAMLLYYSQLGAHESFWAILPGLLLGGIGMGSTMTPVTAAAMSAVPVDKAGVGSAVLNSGRQVGGSLGIAVMGAIVAAGAGSAHTPAAFLGGLHDALRVASVLALAGAVVATAAIRKVEHHHAAERPIAEAA